MLDKIKELGIDLFITIVDDYWHNKYKAEPFKFHQDYHSYKLTFTFEDWSGIINDGKQHMKIIAEYVNAKGQILIKYQDEDFDKLLQTVKEWNDSHRITK